MNKRRLFLLVSGERESSWQTILQRALASLGDLVVVAEPDALAEVRARVYDVVIIDTMRVCDADQLTAQLNAARSGMRVVVATASPTWRRARSAFQAGAADYVTKSRDEEELRSSFEAVLNAPAPLSP